MRVISQDLRFDVPYEQFAFEVDEGNILAYRSTAESGCLMAQYTTEEHAQKAMEMLRETYGRYYLEGSGVVVATVGYVRNDTFRFPAGDKVE